MSLYYHAGTPPIEFFQKAVNEAWVRDGPKEVRGEGLKGVGALGDAEAPLIVIEGKVLGQ